MKSISSLLTVFTLLAASNASFLVPENLPNGLYHVTVDSNNRASAPVLEHALKRSAPAHPHAPIVERQTLPKDAMIQCGGFNMNTYDYAQARSCLDRWCAAGGQTPAKTGTYCTYNTAVAYVCSYNTANPCGNNEWNTSNLLIDANCGSSAAGTVRIDSWTKLYGRTNAGVKIC